MSQSPILVTGAAGRIGGVGGEVVDILRSKGLPVRALVRTDDDRAEALRATGAEVVVGDLTRAEDVARALDGCRRLYFGMSVSAPYLEATVTAAAVARELGGLEAFVNIADNRYDRLTHDFEAIVGRPATSIREYVAKHPEMFGSSKPAGVFP